MGLPEVVDFARNFGVMVRVQGPDPKGLKMLRHAFHHYHSGKTTLSASGMLLPDSLRNAPVANQHIFSDNDMLVVTVASIVEPFLSKQNRDNISQALPKLIPGVEIDIMVEGKTRVENDLEESNKGDPHWLPAQLLTLVDVPISSLALQTLFEASSGSSEHGWEVGWSLASYSAPQTLMDFVKMQVQNDAKSLMESQRHLAEGESNNPNLMAKTTTRIALLGVSSIASKDLPNIIISNSDKRGDLLLAMGSPFGVLSPVHFFNSISVGSIANFCQLSSSNRSLLIADIRCLPGMEGGPVFDEQTHIIGILTRPLRQKTSGAEIQLVIPWEAIATAWSDLLRKEPQNAGNGIHLNRGNLHAVGKASVFSKHDSDGHTIQIHGPHNYGRSPPSPVEKAMTSICLVTIDDGAWASGVLLNKQGLILTNAHLLEPWRFGKTTVNGGRTDTSSEAFFIPSENFVSLGHKRVGGPQKSQGFLSKTPYVADTSAGDDNGGYIFGSTYNGLRRIRVRLDHVDPWIWCDARVVYVSKGPLDIALLQLEFVPDQLCPIGMDFARPSPGSKAYVIGHGLFGPRSDFFPSVCFGVVAKVVTAKMHLSYQSSLQNDTLGDFPAMLETTAAVHPGGSGGAVVNSDGHMIGLVTSNARHGGGTVIPHLNFSIPCAALAPIFKFSKDMQDLSLLHDLDKPNEHLSSIWALMPPLSPKPGPSLPNLPPLLLEDKNKEGKGSRFAKFIAERHEVFRRSTQLGKVDTHSNEIIRSKL
ncbi:hypothetical protein L1049_010202 [Liquidambar formosana]|uniref:Glyoxysomal processing protease, glyoxysomal n=1 Tax=Liquidambar formosana TaxID=63359 RepID=A0AAP0N745_LIQFO